MIGREPNTPVFRQMFNWPDAVVEIETDGSDVASVIRRSDANPDRLAAIGRRNAAQALRQHDPDGEQSPARNVFRQTLVRPSSNRSADP